MTKLEEAYNRYMRSIRRLERSTKDGRPFFETVHESEHYVVLRMRAYRDDETRSEQMAVNAEGACGCHAD